MPVHRTHVTRRLLHPGDLSYRPFWHLATPRRTPGRRLPDRSGDCMDIDQGQKRGWRRILLSDHHQTISGRGFDAIDISDIHLDQEPPYRYFEIVGFDSRAFDVGFKLLGQ